MEDAMSTKDYAALKAEGQMPDNGRALAASLTLDRLESIAKTLAHVRATLDNDEGGAGFIVDHHPNCPRARAYRDPITQPSCTGPCGLANMIYELHQAEADAEQAIEQLRVIAAGKQ
jgi:hypothetical protein